MAKYICLDEGAIEEFVGNRQLQSVDFEAGEKLIKAFAGRIRFIARKIGEVVQIQSSDGVMFVTPGAWRRKKFLVVDCDQSKLFTTLREGETLVSFQKILRFSLKYWNNGIYNHSEKIIPGTSKAVIFPLPYSENKPFRVVIERSPMKERLQKRDMDGQFLLVYKSGIGRGDSSAENPDEANFRRAFEQLEDAYQKAGDLRARAPASDIQEQIQGTNFDVTPTVTRSIYQPFEIWIGNLTEKQRSFVFANSDIPHRLKGPAGTGKTLSLILRVIAVLSSAEMGEETCHALLVTHSEATRAAIGSALDVIDQSGFRHRSRDEDSVSLSVETLASLCAKHLTTSISDAEFVDRDAQDSKILQLMYIEQAIENAMKEDFPSFKPHLSEAMVALFESGGASEISSLVQHEISVLIKGRAGDSYEVYKQCPRLKYGVPAGSDADKGFVFTIFEKYQKQLLLANQFDTDDVVISAIGQLDTPIWRRRRAREGFDFIAVDETHLFNINELHVFHHFTRGDDKLPITFTVDQSQAVGDRGWGDISSMEILGTNDPINQQETNYSAVFRSSPEITEFSKSVLASGATLFTNFENSLASSGSAFTLEDERRSQPIRYIEFADDESMIAGAFKQAEELQRATKSKRSEVLITSLNDELTDKLVQHAVSTNKPASVLSKRGDFTQVADAEKSGHLVLGHADFVGGLEFNAVVVVGVDKGRVPFEGSTKDANSRNYATYAAHNRLYVAATRAKFALELLGTKARGSSALLQTAMASELVSTLAASDT